MIDTFKFYFCISKNIILCSARLNSSVTYTYFTEVSEFLEDPIHYNGEKLSMPWLKVKLPV